MEQRWEDVRDALRRHGDRFAELTRATAARSGSTSTEGWTVADTATHVLSLTRLYTGLFDPDAGALRVPDLPRIVAGTTVDNVNGLNSAIMATLPNRDPARLVDDLRAALDDLLAASDGCDLSRPIPWLGESLVPPAGVLAHLTNEFLVHGWDISRALGRPWPMPDADAALFVEQFLVGMIRIDHGRLLETGARPPRRPIGVEFRSAYTEPVLLVLEGHRVHVGGPGETADARITFRPARFTLMLFGRISTARAVLGRDIVVGGPRPWLLPSYLRVMHLPRN